MTQKESEYNCYAHYWERLRALGELTIDIKEVKGGKAEMYYIRASARGWGKRRGAKVMTRMKKDGTCTFIISGAGGTIDT